MKPLVFSAILLTSHTMVSCQRSVWDIILGITHRDSKLEAIQKNTIDTNAPGGRIKSSFKAVKNEAPYEITTTTTTSTSTTEKPAKPNVTRESGKRKIIINLMDIYHCPATGVFPIDGDCERFLMCRKARGTNEKIKGKVYKCPKGYLFSNVGARCKHEDDVACHRSSPYSRFRKSQQAKNFFLMP
eukprot:TRINITY_DN13443_c0_g1_i1.p1 TRINITY_DN13443_c0_g1~~TRINITY_DN13443_c0_g1_i1.p1  ORF type:complete len:186 (-),score=28.31 TRINITY_DN13443_c0_g1_i1:92-649(-)